MTSDSRDATCGSLSMIAEPIKVLRRGYADAHRWAALWKRAAKLFRVRCGLWRELAEKAIDCDGRAVVEITRLRAEAEGLRRELVQVRAERDALWAAIEAANRAMQQRALGLGGAEPGQEQ